MSPRIPCKWLVGVDLFPVGQLGSVSAIVHVMGKRSRTEETPYYILCKTPVLDVEDMGDDGSAA